MWIVDYATNKYLGIIVGILFILNRNLNKNNISKLKISVTPEALS